MLPLRMEERRGSIPACAGEPAFRRAARQSQKVYPRVCGGTGRRRRLTWKKRGLSPRVRGNPMGIMAARERRGSIPACAGEPRKPGPPTRGARVYPRVCGGTRPSGVPAKSGEGLSPRVRGNRRTVPRRRLPPGSIPACAGEPQLNAGLSVVQVVYPRVCGGTTSVSGSGGMKSGLSPRVRGNRHGSTPSRPCQRSIPACAGEPG